MQFVQHRDSNHLQSRQKQGQLPCHQRQRPYESKPINRVLKDEKIIGQLGHHLVLCNKQLTENLHVCQEKPQYFSEYYLKQFCKDYIRIHS